MPLEPGQTLLHYRILAPLGSGTMGEVYRARDERLGRDVALKVLPPGFARDEQALRRFEGEARALAAASHPGIATIHGLEAAGERRFLVLELVPGEDLGSLLGRGAPPLSRALEIGRQVAEALAAAHAAGVVHRDLKPANVMLTPDGRVKLLDFGLAKRLEFAGTEEPLPGRALTVEGTLLGTVDYMSPEQSRGREVDARSDVWAFGCLLFELLAGARIFPADSVPDKLAAIAADEPDWDALPAETPAEVRALLRRSLAKDRGERPADLGEACAVLARALEELRAGGPAPPLATDPAGAASARPRARRALGLTLALAALLGLAWLGLRQPDSAPPPDPAGADLSPEERERFAAAGRAHNAEWTRRFDALAAPLVEGTLDPGPVAAFAADFLVLCRPAAATRDPETGRLVSRASLGEGPLQGSLQALPPTPAGERELQVLLRRDEPPEGPLEQCGASRMLTVGLLLDGDARPTSLSVRIEDVPTRTRECNLWISGRDAVEVGWDWRLSESRAFRQPMRVRAYLDASGLHLESQSFGDREDLEPRALDAQPSVLALARTLGELSMGRWGTNGGGAERWPTWIGASGLAVLLLLGWHLARGPRPAAPQAERPTGFEGLMPVAGTANEARRGDVVFVHGLDGDAFASWHPARRPAEFWPATLGRSRPDLGVWSLGYAVSSTEWKGGTLPLADRATWTLAELDSHGIGERPLVFVCHSLGGLLVKQLLRQAQGGADERWARLLAHTRGVVFLSTPHAGSDVASWLRYAKLLLPTVTIEELAAHDAQLRDLNKWFRNGVGELGIECQVYFETRRTRRMLVVNATSADPGIPGVNPIPIEADHVTICKPASSEALVALRVRQFVERLLPPAGGNEAGGPALPTGTT